MNQPSVAPQKKPSTPSTAPSRIEPARPAAAISDNLAIQAMLRNGQVQAKLTISHPGDADELEADRVADQVMRKEQPGPIRSSPNTIHRQCAACEAGGSTCPKCGEGLAIQRKESHGQPMRASSAAHSQITSLRGGGQPLPPSVRAFFEPRFGRDFSRVRVHTDDLAAGTARAIQARAFTLGHDMVFSRGEYMPQSPEGRGLLAHELTHVVQQENLGLASNSSMLQRDSSKTADGPGNDAPVATASNLDAATPAKQDKPLKPPAPKGELVVHLATNVTFSDNPEYVRFQLQSFVSLNGTSRLGAFDSSDAVYQFGQGLGPFLDPPSQAASAVRMQYMGRVVSLVRSEVTTLRRKIAEFLSDFERRGVDKLSDMLDSSKARVEKERKRYELKKEESGYSVESGKQTEDLTRRARELIAKRAAVVSAKAELESAQPYGPHGELPPGGAPKQEEQDRESAARDKLVEAQRTYSVARAEAERRHPILVSYQLDPFGPVTAETLGKLGSTSSSTQAETLAAEIDNKLDNIETVRRKVLGDWGKVWDLYPVVEATKTYPDIQSYPGLLAGVRSVVLAEKAGALQAEAELLGLFQGIALLVVGLVAAVPTGGLSLGAAGVVAGAGAIEAGLMAFTAYQATEKFRFDLAASGTDFDKAKAISEEEPTLFWLALDIVGALVTLPKGLSAFRKLVSLRRMAVAAKAAGDLSKADELLTAIRKEGDEIGKSGLGTRLSKETEDLAAARVKHAPEFEEIQQNIAKKRPSTMPGYTEEIPLEGKGDHLWRKSDEGWCRFSDIPMFCFKRGSIEGEALEEQLLEISGEQTSRDTLRKNIIRSGMPLPPGPGKWQAHHIVPWQLRDHPVVVFVRDKFGWSMNSPENGVPLFVKSEDAGALAGKVATHSGSHAGYTMEIANDLDILQESWNNYSPNKIYSEFQRILDLNRAEMIRVDGARLH